MGQLARSRVVSASAVLSVVLTLLAVASAVAGGTGGPYPV